jgi:very-short-patch-repair endonuclease/8-oxo-dGTP pyrophosphatase MutT (NUDIX family)
MPSPTARARALRKDGTKAKNVLWHALRNQSLGGHKFVRQLPVGPYFADFACRASALIVEVDGGQHSGATADVARTAYLNAEGYSVLRFWNNEVLNNRAGVLECILNVIAGAPSPGLRFAPADLSPTGRGIRGVAAAASSHLSAQRYKTITIAAAVILDERNHMLVVKKRGSPYFMQPGGKIEADETPVMALRRELAEEVALVPAGEPRAEGVYSAPAANEPEATVVAHVFSARAAGRAEVGAEIERALWLDPAAPGEVLLAPLTRDHMLALARRLVPHQTGELR